MSASRQRESTYMFGRRDTAGVLLGLDWAQLACVALAGAALTLGFVSAGARGAAVSLLFAVPGLALAFAPVGGEPAVRWSRPLLGTAVQRATKQDRYLGGPVATASELGLPGPLAALRLLTTPSGAAVTDDPRGGVLTVVLEVTGSSFVLLDHATQDRHVAGWGRLLASLCQSQRFARLQWLDRTVPDSGDAMQQWWAARGRPNTPAGRLYAEVIRGVGPAASRHETFLVLSLSTKALARHIRQAGGGPAGAATVVEREMTTFAQAVSAADIPMVGWLTPARLATVIRTAVDPAWMPQSFPPPRKTPCSGGPMAASTHWDHYRTDSGVHATYWIREWPRLGVHAGFLHPLLLECTARRSVSLVAQPLTADKAAKDIRRAKVEQLTNADQRARLGQVADARRDAEYADLLAREADLVAGHGELRYAGYLTVTTVDEAELPMACAAVEQAAMQAHLELRRLYGHQDQGFWAAALPLARGLS